MNPTARRPLIEIAAEWIAACCLAVAAGFAALNLTPTGMFGAAGLGLLCGAAALLALAIVDRDRNDGGAAFAPVAFPGEADGTGERQEEGEVLLLDEPVEDDALWLDTPVIAEPESRVVRLFGGSSEAAPAAGSIPAPGEMLARIEDFLGVTRAGAASTASAGQANAASADASAALHAALADIRRSLRQA
jgi:hypothetical protein